MHQISFNAPKFQIIASSGIFPDFFSVKCVLNLTDLLNSAENMRTFHIKSWEADVGAEKLKAK